MAQKKRVEEPAKLGEKKAQAGRGGARPGAGRKTGSGAFGEATVPMRVPVSLALEMDELLESFKGQVAAKKNAADALAPVSAGKLRAKAMAVVELAGSSPSGKPVDVARMVAEHPESCFAWTATLDMPEWGIKHGDVVVIDRAGKPVHGCVAAVWVAHGIELVGVQTDAQGASASKTGAKKPDHQAKKITELPLWGVVVGLARKF